MSAYVFGRGVPFSVAVSIALPTLGSASWR